MAQHTTVQLIDDVDGGPADETIQFGFRGAIYEIDLAEEHIKEMAEFLGPFMDAGRRVSTPTIHRRTVHSVGASVSRREDYNAIRAWARENGYEVADKGRIAAHIVEAYRSR